MKVNELKPKQLYRIIIGENGNNPNAFVGVGIFKEYKEDTKEAIYEEAVRFKNGKPEIYKGFYKSVLEYDKFYPGLTMWIFHIIKKRLIRCIVCQNQFLNQKKKKLIW